MIDMGNGQWFAEVRAIVRNPSSTGEDHDGSWRPHWDGSSYYGNPQTIALPAGAKPGDGHQVSYTMRRDYESGTRWSMPSNQQATVTEGVDPDYLGPDDVVGGPVVGSPHSLLTGIKMAAEWILFGDGVDAGSGSITAVDDQGDALPMVPTTESFVQSVYARCTINVDVPATEAAAGPQWIIIDLPDNPEDPAPPTDDGDPQTIGEQAPNPGGEGGTSSCSASSGSWWNPVSWAKSLFQVTKCIWDWITGLPAWLQSMFVPQVGLGPRAESIKTDFTASVAGQGISAVTDLAGDVEAALEAPEGCGTIFPTSQAYGENVCLSAGTTEGTTLRNTVTSASGNFIRVLLYVLTGLRIWRTMPWAGRESGSLRCELVHRSSGRAADRTAAKRGPERTPAGPGGASWSLMRSWM